MEFKSIMQIEGQCVVTNEQEFLQWWQVFNYFCKNVLKESKTGDLKMANAGHNPPIIGNEHKGYTYIKIEQNIALGVLEDFNFSTEEEHLQAGDKIILYTDGITEAFNKEHEIFTDDRLIASIADTHNLDSVHLIRKIQQEIKNFVKDAEQSDDITILALTYKGHK